MLSWQRQKQEYHVVSREQRFLHEASAIHHLVVIRNFVTAGAPTHHPVKHRVFRHGYPTLHYETRADDDQSSRVRAKLLPEIIR